MMMNLEQNLDAYRVLADVLTHLREAVRNALQVRFGDDWHRVPELAEVVDRLIARKEREKAIDWYSSEYQELLDFAAFQDLLEVVENIPDLIPQIKILVPSPHLLHARMLELEALREKIAMGREVTEGELSFLTTFHMRFLKAMDAIEKSGGLPAVHEEDIEVKKEKIPEAKPGGEPTGQSIDGRGTEPVEIPKTAPAGRKPAHDTPSGGGNPAAAAAVEEAPKAEDQGILAALEEGDTKAILHHLYQEVTTIADGIFSAGNTASPVCWRSVRRSTWYESNFSALGLQPLSDFYAIVNEAMDLRDGGAQPAEIQEFLKEHNFAKVLLRLRDMFQKNKV